MVKTIRKKGKSVFGKVNGNVKRENGILRVKGLGKKEITKKLKLIEKKEKEIKESKANIKASRDFLAQKENILNAKEAEIKEKEELFSNMDLSKITEEEVLKLMDGKISSQFIRDVVTKNIEMKKKEKEHNDKIREMENREKELQAEIDNVLKIIEEVQK